MDELMPQNPLENLGMLSKRHLEVLELFCLRMTYKKIGQELFIGESTVKTYMQQVYWILGLRYLDADERKQIIQEVICPEIQKREIIPVADEKVNIPKELPPELDDMVTEDEKAIAVRGPDIIDVVPVYKPIRRRRFPWEWVIILGLGIALIYVTFFRGGPDQQVVANPTNDSEIIKETVIVTATSAPDQPTQTSIIEEKVVEVTPTLPSVTDAPEIPLVNPAGTIFFDDFEERPDPAWEVLYGELDMARKSYTVTAPFMGYDKSPHYAVLRGQYWENMTITVNLLPFAEGYNACCFAELGIIFRYKDNGNSLGVFIHPADGGIEFGTLHQNGQWDPHMGTLVTGKQLGFDLSKEGNQIVLEAKNQTYVVYLNNQEITSASSTDFEYGEIGLWFIPDSTNDDVDSYAARIEDIRIESLP